MSFAKREIAYVTGSYNVRANAEKIAVHIISFYQIIWFAVISCSFNVHVLCDHI